MGIRFFYNGIKADSNGNKLEKAIFPFDKKEGYFEVISDETGFCEEIHNEFNVYANEQNVNLQCFYIDDEDELFEQIAELRIKYLKKQIKKIEKKLNSPIDKLVNDTKKEIKSLTDEISNINAALGNEPNKNEENLPSQEETTPASSPKEEEHHAPELQDMDIVQLPDFDDEVTEVNSQEEPQDDQETNEPNDEVEQIYSRTYFINFSSNISGYIDWDSLYASVSTKSEGDDQAPDKIINFTKYGLHRQVASFLTKNHFEILLKDVPEILNDAKAIKTCIDAENFVIDYHGKLFPDLINQLMDNCYRAGLNKAGVETVTACSLVMKYLLNRI